MSIKLTEFREEIHPNSELRNAQKLKEMEMMHIVVEDEGRFKKDKVECQFLFCKSQIHSLG
jgi:hypothetical protein